MLTANPSVSKSALSVQWVVQTCSDLPGSPRGPLPITLRDKKVQTDGILTDTTYGKYLLIILSIHIVNLSISFPVAP